MDPFSAGMFASIGSAFKFADVAVRVAEVGSENAVFVRTIYVVRSDLEEVERLLSQEPVQRKLAATPGKLPWIKKAIQNTRYALNEIGRWVERARVEQESKGSIKLDTRVRWVFSDHEKLLNRKTELSTCHQQLSIVLGFLIGLEVAPSQQAEQEYEDTTYFDDILARHRRTSRPKLQNTDSNQKHLAVPPNSMNGYAADPVPSASSHLPPPGSRVTISPTVRTSNPYEREKFIRSKSLTSTLSLPGSPPPTYATAVSVDRFTSAAQPSPRNSCSPPKAYNCVLPGPTADYEITLDSPQNETWAYRSSYEGIAIPELTGDTVVFSATNSAGPVNPYEFCASPGATTRYDINSSRRSRDSIPEMLGDLFFPAELPSNVPGSPTGLPPCSWAATDQVGMPRTSHLELRHRMMPEGRSMVQRRPVPINTFSDSLHTVHELPQSLAPHDPPLLAPNVVFRRSTCPLTPGSSSGGSHQLENIQRSLSYTAHQSHWGTQAPIPASQRHCSAPLPIPLTQPEYAAAFSTESMSSRAHDTQPKVPNMPQAQDPVKATRMQSQKKMMDLLGTIGG